MTIVVKGKQTQLTKTEHILYDKVTAMQFVSAVRGHAYNQSIAVLTEEASCAHQASPEKWLYSY